jgi:flagellar basal body-associated protein FliL
VLLLANPSVSRAAVLLSDLEARGVVRKAGHAVLIIIVILIVLGVLLGVGLTAMFRRRR